MKRSLFAVLLALGLAFAPGTLLTSGVSAQLSTLTATTLSVAVTSTTATTISLASTSGVLANDILYVDREGMLIRSVNTAANSVVVTRGWNATRAALHGTSANVFIGLPSQFYQAELTGACTLSNEQAGPVAVILSSGNQYQCASGYWVLVKFAGQPYNTVAQLGAQGGSGMTYTTNGAAITIQPGIQFISGSGVNLTLASPTIAQNGMVMILTSADANAHTVTYTPGFGGGTSSRDVATFGGAVNDSMAIVAVNGTWWLLYTRNVSLG